GPTMTAPFGSVGCPATTTSIDATEHMQRAEQRGWGSLRYRPVVRSRIMVEPSQAVTMGPDGPVTTNRSTLAVQALRCRQIVLSSPSGPAQGRFRPTAPEPLEHPTVHNGHENGSDLGRTTRSEP